MMSQRPLPVLFVFVDKQGHAESEACVDFSAGSFSVNFGAEYRLPVCILKKPPMWPPSLPSQVQGLGSPRKPQITVCFSLYGQKC